MCVLHFRHRDPSVQYRNRSAKKGPEFHMVQTFMADYERRLKRSGADYAIFYEPQVPTGYPDCVIVKFDSNAYSGWKKRMIPLVDADMRILHILSTSRGLTVEALSEISGFQTNVLICSLERLGERGLVQSQGKRWSAAPRKKASGIRHIMSLEAKISNCRGVLDQAVRNCTFSNESYVLMPTRQPSDKTISAAQSSGLGVFLLSENGNGRQILKPTLRKGEKMSYTTWYFNEWIGRRLAQRRRS